MGTSTDAILVFGFEIGGEDEPPEFLDEFDGDFESFLDSLSGLPEYGEEGHSFDAQFEYRKNCPASMTLHCSYDYPMYILAVNGTETRSSRGTPREIGSMDVSDSDVSAFKAWCESNDIEYKEPKWLLCSMWG